MNFRDNTLVLPQDIAFDIYDLLNEKSLNSVPLVCKAWHESVTDYWFQSLRKRRTEFVTNSNNMLLYRRVMKILFARSNQVIQGSKIESKQGEVSTEGRIDFTESYSHQKPLISPNRDNNCTTLTFKGFSLTGRELSFIPHIFPRLENIKLAGFLANMADSKRISILVGIANCTQIKGLDLSNNGLKGSDLEVLSSLKSLICLNLSKNPEICLYGLKFLATSNLAKQLCYLDISKGTVNTETLKFQNAKMKKKAERKIKLRSKGKKAYPTESITLTFPFDSIYENFVNLNYLDLSENNIGDIRAKKLSFPQSLQNLKLINNLLSSDIKSCLRTAYPSINIEF